MRNEQVLRPHVAVLIEHGEAELAAGRITEAAADFQKAVEGSPHSALPRRRLCIALVALGRRTEAIQACQGAAANLGSGMDLRALVGAIVSAPPTPAELGTALAYAQRAITVMDRQPWGYAAQCDIMRRLGDIELLTKCLEDLRRVAPNHYETKRIEAIVASLRPSVSVIAAWVALALLTLWTALHALRARWRARGALVATLMALAILGAPSAAQAATDDAPPVAGSLSRYKIDDAHPSASVPSAAERDANPLEYGYFLMDLADHADKATQRGDHQTAAELWMALYKAVPDRSVSLIKACESYEAAGDWPKSVAACKLALEKGGLQVKDFARFVTVSLQKPTALDAKEIADIDRVVAHLSKTDANAMVAHELNCNVGMKLSDVERLETCSAALAARVPGNPQTLYYQWGLALLKGDTGGARKFLAQAQVAGATPQRISEMTRLTAERGSVWRRFGRRGVLLTGVSLLAGALIIAIVRAIRARSTPHVVQG